MNKLDSTIRISTDFIRILYSFRVVIILSVIPLLIIGMTSQGKELINLVLERLEILQSRGVSVIFFAAFFFFKTQYIIQAALFVQESKLLKNAKFCFWITSTLLPIGISIQFAFLGSGAYRLYISFAILLGYLLAIDRIKWNIFEFSESFQKRATTILIISTTTILLILLLFNESTRFKYVVIPGLCYLVLYTFVSNKKFVSRNSNSDLLTRDKIILDSRTVFWFEYAIVTIAIVRLVKIYYNYSTVILIAMVITGAIYLGMRIYKNEKVHGIHLYHVIIAIYAIYIFIFSVDSYVPLSMTNLLFGYGAFFIIVFNLFKVDYKFKGPYSILIIAILVVFNQFNDNTRIPVCQNQRGNLQSISTNFESWIDFRNNEIDSCSSTNNNKIFVPLVASEGGGMRSAFWTTGVLFKLDSLLPNLMYNTYAISGVSGGSVGAMYYYSIKHDIRKHGLSNKWDKILGGDYLGDVILGITIGSLIQTMCPFPIYGLDRSAILSNDWKKQYEKNYYPKYSNLNTLDNSILSFYQDSFRYKTPNLFFNSTNVETGKKTIISNLSLNGFFDQDIKLWEATGEHISICTGAMLSARFPLVSPSGLALNKVNSEVGRFVDGGYYDNSGLLTLIDIANILSSYSSNEQEIIPILIFLRNNKSNQIQPHVSSNKFSSINAFLNSWNSRTERTVMDVKNECIEKGFVFCEIGLDHIEGENDNQFPLGWTLSQSSQQAIVRQINRLGNADSYKIRTLRTLDSLVSQNYN